MSTLDPSETPSAARPPPASLTNLQEILAAISSLESEEAELSASLAQLLAQREPIVQSLDRLQTLEPHLDDLHYDASLLSGKVSATARTAERVGGRVRSLDEEMRRVRDAGERVGQVMELKSSLDALKRAIEIQDWESATRHCARAMALPASVISGPFAETTVPSEQDPLPPAQALENARAELLDVFRRNFERASAERDAAATSRFFKLFPAIGWEAEGLEAYAAFVVDLVRVRPPASAKASSPLYYITALTALFESIAMIVDQHQPVVEKYYGTGKMTSVVARLLQECDRVVKGLLEGWEEQRSMKRKLTDTAASMIGSRQPMSPAIGAEDDPVDPREIDRALSETASMAGRWSLFRKFLFERLQEDESGESEGHEEAASKSQVAATADAHPESKALPATSPEFQAVEDSACRRLFEEFLNRYYIPLETWYAHTTIDKAHRLASPDLSTAQATTTTPDDVFYILKIVLARMLSTGSVSAVEQTSEGIRDIMDYAHAGVIKRKLDDVYRTAGTTAGSRGDKAERESRTAFIMLLNDLDISTLHLDRLVKDVQGSPAIEQNFLDNEVADVRASISSLLTLSAKFKSTLRAGVEQLFNQLIRPKLRTFIPDVYKDVPYVLDDDSYASAEYQDVVRKRFMKALEALLDGYKDAFTEPNFRLFFGLVIDVLVRPWEKFVMTLRFNELGAIRFDRDLRAITTYLSSQTAFGDVREKFSRLQQMSSLLNLDNEEDVDEFYNGSGITWKLSLQEARAVGSLRV